MDNIKKLHLVAKIEFNASKKYFVNLYVENYGFKKKIKITASYHYSIFVPSI